jgi:RNA polymerase sigma-70 factor (ECF subfamily)
MDLKQVISLKYFSCLSLAEISEIMKIPLGTAKSKLNRALKILRLEVEEN